MLGAPCRDPLQLGSGHEGLPCPWFVEWYHLEMLAVFRALKHFLPDLRDNHVLVHTDKEACVCAPFTGWCTRSLCGPRETPLAESSSHSWASQYGSRHPVDAGAEAR